jgi:exopolyphosphatase/guanosine-5'-triphosphate,3'-diphosphate pyrophosphatase
MTLGIIDVGTNSIHLLIGAPGPNGKFRVLRREQRLTRLGEGGLSSGRLARRAMGRALTVLRGYAATLKRRGVDQVSAVATSAVRDARNGRAFVRQVRRRLRLPLRIISGREEARLIYLGLMRGRRFRGCPLVIAIGGGSAQVMCGDGARLRYAASVALGSARLAQRFIKHDPARPDEVEAMERHARRVWAPVVRALRRHRWRQGLGGSAMICQLLETAARLAGARPPGRSGKRSITRAALRRLVERLSSATAAERRRLPGLDPRREDLALPTGAALLTLMEAAGVRSLTAGSGSLREGLVVDYLIRRRRRSRRAGA